MLGIKNMGENLGSLKASLLESLSEVVCEHASFLYQDVHQRTLRLSEKARALVQTQIEVALTADVAMPEKMFCLLLGHFGFNWWFSFCPIFQWCCFTP